MKRAAIFLVLFICLTSVLRAQVDWPTLHLTQIASGADSPVYITSAHDGSERLFVVQQPGQVLVVSGTTFSSTPFLDISDRVKSGGEQGLLSIAFPPGFSSTGTNHYFYVNYTGKPDGQTTVSRIWVNTSAGNADASTEQILLTILQPFANHNGGQLQFGPDGFLYIGMGDGGDAGDPGNRAQNPGVLLGKMLRIDVESTVVQPGAELPNPAYAIPADNPFVHRQKFKPEIWARGLRNPWRFAFDRGDAASQTGLGNLYIGDVGQDKFEEVDFQPASSKGGENYGWRLREGNHNFNVPSGFPPVVLANLTRPIFVYPHPVGNAVTGGYVYRGSEFTRMKGIYFVGDFISGRVWGLKRDETNGVWRRKELAETGLAISTFGEDESGELYLANYNTGKIFRIDDSGLAWEPVIIPDGGTFYAPRKVTLHDASLDAKIHYTLNGNDPTETDPFVAPGGQITLHKSATLKVRAFRSDLQASDIATAQFTLQ